MTELGGPRRFAQRKHYDDGYLVEKKIANHLNGPVLDLATVPDDANLSLTGDIGKLHFPPSYSGSYEGKASKRRFEPKQSGHAKHPGKKVLKPPPNPQTFEDLPQGKKPIPEMRNKRSKELPANALTTNWNNKRVVQQGIDCDGPPCRERRSEDFRMEQYMNRKQRYEADLCGGKPDPMNDAGVAYSMAKTSQVDFSKEVRGRVRSNNQNPEYSVGYFIEGGLVAGSTIAAAPSKTSKVGRKAEGGVGETAGKTLRSYKEIAKMREMEYDLQQVAMLSKPSEKMGRKVPSWEEKTGLYLVKPEDEKD